MSDVDLAISIDAVVKTYKGGLFRNTRVEALKGVSFDVEQGEIFGLLGPNGAGKTTLVKVLLGIVRKNGGSATVLGKPAGDRKGRRGIGYLPETHRIPRHHTGYSALAYYGQLSGLSRAETRKKSDALLDLVGLAKSGRMPVHKYSKGMLQRLGLAQSILHDPQLIVLDEPTDGVDPVGRNEIRQVLTNLRDEGKTIFLNSHLLQEVELICDRVVVLVEGNVRTQGRVSELTQTDGTEVEFILVDSQENVRAALDSLPIVQLQQEGAGTCRLTLNASNQSELDRCVDAIRKQGISIRRFAKKRSTLEEAFINIVTNEGGPS